MNPLTQVAGFICNEGQPVATLKQIVYTLIVAGIFFWLSKFFERSTKYRFMKIMTLVVGVIFAGIVFVVGPFFYSSWGCASLMDPIIMRLLTV